MNTKKHSGNNYTITIGEKLRKVLDKQKEIVKDMGWGEVYLSDYEAGEIIAKKITENKLV
jgi:hypothetical protein